VSKKRPPSADPLPLRDGCIVAAQQVIAERGVENLSLRDVARKLGVSHQAPYKHYASRDHLLAEVMRRCFEAFAAHLDARAHFDDPMADLESLGHRYLGYAQAHPLEYRLMFSTPWPEAADRGDLARNAVHAFDILRQVMRRLHGGAPSRWDRADLDALYIWSSMHGVAGVMHGACIDGLDLKDDVRQRAMQHVMEMVGRSLAVSA
jgi:AcrR family transcriptional regulator